MRNNTNNKLSYEYIRGLVDGEGCFTFCTTPDKSGKKYKLPTFEISMHVRDKNLLEMVRDTLSLKNKVYEFLPYTKDGYNRGNKATLSIRDYYQLRTIIVPFFYNNLKGYKNEQFFAWLEKIGNDPVVHPRYRWIYWLHKTGYYKENPKFLD